MAQVNTIAHVLKEALTAASAIPSEFIDDDSRQNTIQHLNGLLIQDAQERARISQLPDSDVEKKALAMMDDGAALLYKHIRGLSHPGSFINTLDYIGGALSTISFQQQLQSPEAVEDIRRKQAEAKAKSRDEAIGYHEEAIAALRKGTTGPGVENIQAQEDGRPEQVLVIPRGMAEQIIADPLPSRFITADDVDLRNLRPFVGFVDRDPAEVNPDLKQLIVYAIVVHEGKVLQYTRGKKGGEQRLHGKNSIGVGGHINPVDWEWGSTARMGDNWRAALLRELKEEIGVLPGHINNTQFLGFVNNDAEVDPEKIVSVGHVHLGLVFLVELDNLAGNRIEEAMVNPIWVDPASLMIVPTERHDNFSRLEAWSQMVVDGVFPLKHIEDLTNVGGSTAVIEGVAQEIAAKLTPAAGFNDFSRNVILLQGPAASGKSRLAKALAPLLGGDVRIMEADEIPNAFEGYVIGEAKSHNGWLIVCTQRDFDLTGGILPEQFLAYNLTCNFTHDGSEPGKTYVAPDTAFNDGL